MSKKNECLKLNKEELEKLHSNLLLLLKEFDRICRKHNIKYYLSDGTLLGAVRHKGFVPWDDDIDVQMSRSEYERFCEVCKEELDKSKFFFQNQETDKHYNWVYGKLRLKNTTYMRVGQEHLKQDSGIFMDIFPLDNISDNKFTQYYFEVMCKMCRKIFWAPVGCVVKEHFYSRLFFKLLCFIPRKLTIRVFEFFAKFYQNKETDLFAYYNLDYLRNERQVLKKEWYKKSITMEFEGYEFFVPEAYDEILTATYGDYMKLPPEDKRGSTSPASYIKFLDGTEVKLER